MKKETCLTGLGIFTLLLISLVSAEITLSGIPTALSQSGGSFDINVSSNETERVTLSVSPIIKDYSGKEITFTFTPNYVDLNSTTPSAIVNLTYIVPSGFDFFGKEYSTTLTASGNVSGNFTQMLKFEQTPFCKWDGNDVNESHIDDDLEVKIRDISVVKGFGEDEEWYPLDEIEVEVRVRNRGDYDIDDIVVEWGLFNKKTGEWTIEVDEEKDFNIKDGDEKTLTLTFKLEDLDEDFEDLDNGDFIFYVRATGTVDNKDGEDYDACASDYSEEVDLVIEDDFVILDDIQMPESVSCGEDVQISADFWNIGEDDQEEVYVFIYNKELGINEKVIIGDIDAFENEKLDTLIKIPKDAEEKYYTLTFYVYNEDNEVYENDNDDEAVFFVPLKVEGNCIFDPKLTVTANLVSGGKAGQELVVKAVLKNTDSKTRIFNFEAGSYESWAELVDVEPTSLILNANESKDVLFTFNVNKDVSGEKAFNVLIYEGTNLIVTQPVLIPIEGRFSFSEITGAVIGENWYLWGIGALNIILVIAIIFVALRLVRKK